ncbi:MAG: ChaN family lipoprotein [Acidobacteria bacterium]|nr:ChaN family lipoprotein [Acidobacteriota bacterium]
MPASETLAQIAVARRAVARLRGEIHRVDGASRGGYVRTYHREFPHLQTLSSFDDLVVACFKADIIYVGDFHALPASQHFAARLLHEVFARSRRGVLAMEMVYGRHQAILDAWMEGKLSDADFLRRTRYEQEWGYDWNAFRSILETARRRGVPAYGIDSAPRAGIRRLRQRDRYMAARIADIYAARPDAKVVVIVGESHLATSHLPVAVREELASRNLERRSIRVLQNLEEVYWDLVARGHEHADTVTVGRNVFCVFNTSPIEKYEAYRHTIERWNQDRPDDTELDLTASVHTVVDAILSFLGIDKYRKRRPLEKRGAAATDGFLVDAYPEVYASADLAGLERLLRAEKLPRRDLREISEHIRRNGSCYIPRINAIYLGAFNLVHAGEEAAHFVNHALRGDAGTVPAPPASRADAFYAAVMEEALGFFGSKVIDPSRNHFFETEFYRFYRKSRDVVERETGYRYEEFCEIIDFILLHKKFERGYAHYDEIPPQLLAGIRTADRARFSVLTHELGYFLGQQIYDGYQEGSLRRAEILRLFERRFTAQGEALTAYLDLTERLPGGVAAA